MWGSPAHLTEMARVIQEAHDHKQSMAKNDLHVLVAQTNSDEFTYDGIDYGGERVAEEVSLALSTRVVSFSKICRQLLQEIKKLSNEGRTVTKISVCGYR